MRGTQRFLGLLTGAVLAVAACGGTSAPSAGEPAVSGQPAGNAIKVQLPAAHGARFAGYYAAIDQGFYKDAGFDVELLAGADEQVPGSAVAGGTAQYGVAPAVRVMQAREAGADLVFVGQMFQRSGTAVASPAANNIDGFPLLKGKKLGLRNDGSQIEILQAMGKAGVKETDATITTVTDPSGLLTGALDAVEVVTYEDLVTLLEAPNASGGRWTRADLEVFDQNDPFVNTFMMGDGVFTKISWLAETGNEDLTVRFLTATSRGWIWCRDNLDACAGLSAKHGATGGPSHEKFVLVEALALVWPAVTGIGEIDRPSWFLAGRVAVQGGILKGEPADAAFRIDLAELSGDELDELKLDTLGRQWDKPVVEVNEGGS
jgi:NitT/TauT family transport system substrate-binding protein